MYRGKKRQDSRHWWRRIQSGKYRRLLIIEIVLVLMVTAAMLLLAFLNIVRYSLCLLAWPLAVGIILIPLIMKLRRRKSKRPHQRHRTSARLSKPQKLKVSSPRPDEASISRIKEIASKTINTHSEHTKSSKDS
jgi:hypothetical protein